MKKAVIVAFDKFTDIDIFLAWDLLNRVKYRDKEFEIKIVGTAASHQSVTGMDLKHMDLLKNAMKQILCFLAADPGQEM
jgi:hypothetical protein